MKQTWKILKTLQKSKDLQNHEKTWKINKNHRKTSKHHWKSLKDIKNYETT